MTSREFNHWLATSHRPPLVMGVLNVTPDSFSDGGDFLSPERAVDHANQMIADGADLIDIGGESTKPGSGRIGAEEQIARVIPVIKAIRKNSDVVISIDTTLAAVADAAADSGANIVNDVSAGRDDPQMLPLAARRAVPIILMHMRGQPATMQDDPVYSDVTAEVGQFLRDRLSAAIDAGIDLERVLLDPGFGFGKTLEHNLDLLARLPKLAAIGLPLVVGTSRKRFIGTLTGQSDPKLRTAGTLATVAWSLTNGAAIVRVHDVGPVVAVVRVVQAINARIDPKNPKL